MDRPSFPKFVWAKCSASPLRDRSESIPKTMASVAVDYGHDVSETDYGYGDAHNTDYGYGDQNMDYGYGDQNMDYGYGDQNNSADYGYGSANVDYGYGAQTDYGYGDAEPTNTDYGYGDSGPSNIDYDYGNSETTEPSEPAKSAPKPRRPRRRCSVTKYSLEETAEKGSAEAEMVKNLHAAEMLQKFRQGL